MPFMDGLEATRRIRLFEKTAGRPRAAHIMALTAHASEADRDGCLAEARSNIFYPVQSLCPFVMSVRSVPSYRALDYEL